MRNVKLIFIIGFMFAAESVVLGLDSPIASPTTPQSAYGAGSSSLTPNRSASNLNAGNDIVTGNVSGGKYFRGIVPYGSPYYFQGGQGSSSVESFRRYTAGDAYSYDRAPQRTQTYVSPYQAVTTLRNSGVSNSQVYTPQSPISRPTQSNPYGLSSLEEARKLFAPTPKIQGLVPTDISRPIQYGRFRPLTATPEEKESYITQEIYSKLTPAEQLESQKQLEQYNEQLRKLEIRNQEDMENLTIKPVKPLLPDEVRSANPLEPGQKEIVKPERVPGVFEEMQLRARSDFDKSMEERAKKSAEEKREADRLKLPAETEKAKEQEREGGEPKESTAAESFREISPGMAKAILGYSQTFAVQSKDKFNELMAAGERYLKESKFYKAADAYTLAAVYQDDNPLPYAGKSHALFAAGEYMSSAFYLARAIEIWPDFLRFKVDFRKLFDKDLIENRIADVSQWQEKTDSPELLMLLGYVYYQTDRLEQAQMSINGAMVKMPESKAIKMLDKVVDMAIEQAQKK